MRVLLVEDDRRLASGLEASLKLSGYEIDVARDGEAGLEMAALAPYGAIILDLGLPDIDGLDVLRRLRTTRITAPVLILTARDAVTDRVEGLDRGADDYLAKPFDPRELESRLRALIRRSQGSPDPVLRIGALSLDRSTGSVRLHASPLDLRRRELAVLQALMSRPGKLVTKEKLLDEVFSFADAVAPNAMEVYIGRLRRKLLPDGPNIRTIRGLGYMIDAD